MTELERAMQTTLRQVNIDMPEAEYEFHPSRKWRFDFADPENKIAIECEGGVYTRGRHTRGSGFVGDMEKYNEAARLGWKVFRFWSGNIESGEAALYMRDVYEKVNDD